MIEAGREIGEDSTTTPGGWPPSLARVEAAKNGDRQTLGEVLTLGYPKLVAFYRGMGLTSSDAEDLASEAIEGMVRNLPRLRDAAAFEAWFWTVARNRFRSRLRRKGRPERELEYPPVDDPEERAIAHHEHALIRGALAGLPPRDRAILWLREVEGLSHEEIGGRIGLATGAVRVAVLRARRKLEKAYRESDPG